MSYAHTQTGRLHWILLGFAVFVVVVFWPIRDLVAQIISLAACALFVFLAFSFRSLTVQDDGDRLRVFFGPIPLFRTSVGYDQIQGVRIARSKFLDGWGVHYWPGRGTIFNVWGFDCVEVDLERCKFRIGTDDADRLARFLEQRSAAD